MVSNPWNKNEIQNHQKKPVNLFSLFDFSWFILGTCAFHSDFNCANVLELCCLLSFLFI